MRLIMKQSKKWSLKAEHNNEHHNTKLLILELSKKEFKIKMNNILKALMEK